MRTWIVTMSRLIRPALVACLFAASGCSGTHDLGSKLDAVNDNIERLVFAVTEMSETATNMGDAAVDLIKEEGLLDTWMAAAEAQGINPRFVVADVVEKRREYGLGGIAVIVGGEAKGVGRQIPADIIQSYLTRLADPAITDAERASIIEIIRTDLARTQPRNPPDGP